MSLLFIINPIAGKGKASDAVPLIEQYCSSKGIAFKAVKTLYSGHATELAQLGAQEGCSSVIAVGGDGTILETANGLIGTDIPLGIIPLGSGNDFARALNVPIGLDTITDALDIITNTKPQKVDMGRINGRVFLNVASIGFDAEIIRDLHKVKRFVKGPMAYLLSVFLKFISYKPKKATLFIDDEKIDARLFLAAICNGTSYGGGMMVNPEGSITDGCFDVVLISPPPRYKIPFLLIKFMKGQHLELPYVTTYRCKEVRIISEEELTVNIDGECDKTPINFSMAPLSIGVFGRLMQEEK